MDRADKEPGVDLEALEFGLRSAVLSAGATLLEQMLSAVGVGRLEQALVCSCGERMNSKGLKEKRIQTILGENLF